MIIVTMVYVYTGKNTFELSAQLKKVVATFIKDHGDLAVERIDASETDINSVLQAVQSLPFLAEKKLVIIKRPSGNSELLDRLPELVDRTLENVDVYLVDQAFDKRKTYYKDLKKITELTEFTEHKNQDLNQWVSSAVGERSGKISSVNVSLLVDRIGPDQQRIIQEIDKLLLYNPEITQKSIEMLTDESMQSSIFTLLDEAFKGNKAKTLSLYRNQRTARVDTNYIISMLTWQLQSLALAVYADPQTESSMISAGQSPYSARKSINLARMTSRARLQGYVVSLSEIDAETKNSVVDPDAALELFLLSLA